MLIKFDEIKEVIIPHLNKGEVSAKMSIQKNGKEICDGKEEILISGVCHYCPKGSSHSIINTGTEDLILFTVVPEL